MQDDLLERTVLERLRTLAPVALLSMSSSLALSEPSGVPLTAFVVVVNVVMIALLTIVLVALLMGRIPMRFAHLVSAFVTGSVQVTTLVSIYESGHSELFVLLVLEIMAAGLMTSLRWMLGMVFLGGTAWAFIAYPIAGKQFGFQLSAVAATIVVAAVFQVMLVRLMKRERKTEVDRAALRDQLVHAQRLEAVGTLAAGLAHDMNNILGAIMGYADLIANSVDDPEVRNDANGIIDEAERGAVLTRSLLAFSRRGQYRKEPISLESVVGNVRTILARTLPKAITVHHIARADANVDADIVQLGQVVMNLAINAADAMEGAGSLTIIRDVRRRDGRDWAVLEVIDTGHGMDEATRARIFEPFFTTKAAGKGTGLGLALVYGVVTAHGGMLEVASKVGHGTTFTIHLPITKASVTVRPARLASQKFEKLQRVLVVDDEPAFRQTATRVLEKLGLAASTATNGAEGLEVFAQHEFALVVLDMNMPVMGGAECFRKLRATSNVPILITSGYALESETQELLAAGRTAFLEKPFHAAELSKQVRALLADTESYAKLGAA